MAFGVVAPYLFATLCAAMGCLIVLLASRVLKSNLKVAVIIVAIGTTLQLGSVPFEKTDYADGYLNSLATQGCRQLGRTAPSKILMLWNASRDLECVSWDFLAKWHEIIGSPVSLQILCVMVLVLNILLFWLGLHRIARSQLLWILAPLYLTISAGYQLFTTWFLRQGLATSLFISALALDLITQRSRMSPLSRLGIMVIQVILFGASYACHRSILSFWILYFIVTAVMRLSTTISKKIKLQSSARLSSEVIMAVICSAIIIYYIFGILEVVNYTSLLNWIQHDYINSYQNSAWGPSRVGLGFTFYLALALGLMFLPGLTWRFGCPVPNSNNVVFKLGAILMLLVLLSGGISAAVTSLAGRLIMGVDLLIQPVVVWYLEQKRMKNTAVLATILLGLASFFKVLLVD